MNNKEELTLYVPRLDELWFYQKLLSDPDTMSYNAKWFPPDGCIEFPEEEWECFHKGWVVNQEPKRFYAYIQRMSDGAFVGDVNFHYTKENNWWDMGILILASERGKGYSKGGLKLLLERAFVHSEVKLLHNYFEKTREVAYKIHKDLGFKEVDQGDECYHLFLSREDYLKNRR
ncbi:GNAT family N-acetyltransferase [Guggenheimella bovis]